MEVVLSIQKMYSPGITKELLLSYFNMDIVNKIREEVDELKLTSFEPLSIKQVEQLLFKKEQN